MVVRWYLGAIIFAALSQAGCGAPGTGECAECHAQATCTDAAGGYRCECNPGFLGDGRTCERRRAAGLVLLDATLIDGNGGPPVSGSALAIVGDRIAEVAPTESVFVYPDDQVLDLAGRVVMPGVINAHVHEAHSEENLEAWARAGVTTVREVGAPLLPPPEWPGVLGWDDWATAILRGAAVEDFLPPSFALRDAAAAHPGLARVLMAGPCVTAAGGYPEDPLALHVNLEPVVEDGVTISPEQDARRKVQVLADAGADAIKICLENQWGTTNWELLTRDQVAAIVEVAQATGLRVTAHVSAEEQLARCLQTRPPLDDAAHMVADRMSDETIAAMVELGVIQVPTLAVWESLSICADFGKCAAPENLGRFVAAGGQVAVGDDYGNSGIALGMPMRDLALMQVAGMTPMQILVAATKNGAAACGLLDELGTVEAGKRADLVVPDGDPLADFAALAEPAYVIHGGQIIRQPG